MTNSVPGSRLSNVIIQASQIHALEQAAEQRFENEMVLHSRDFSPTLSAILSEEQLRAAVRSAISRARGYGFTKRGPIRLFVEMTFLWGSGFDTDPQYSWVQGVLGGCSDQMWRAQRIYNGYLDYLDRASGPGAANVHRALRHLLLFSRMPMALSGNFTAAMLGHMRSIFPEKSEYVGEQGLRTLIAAGLAEAERYQFVQERQRALVVVLQFAFGHRCTDDPLYPWISRTLADDKIATPEVRAARLEKKAITWLEHVVIRNERRQA